MQKNIVNDGHVRCTQCSKLLAKNLTNGNFEIKCPRCSAFNVFFEKTPWMVVVTDSEGKIIFANDAVEEISGFRAIECVGKRPSDLWGGQMPKEFYKNMWKLIKEEKKTFSGSLTNKMKTGKTYCAELSISPILNPEGNIVNYYCGERRVEGSPSNRKV